MGYVDTYYMVGLGLIFFMAYLTFPKRSTHNCGPKNVLNQGVKIEEIGGMVTRIDEGCRLLPSLAHIMHLDINTAKEHK